MIPTKQIKWLLKDAIGLFDTLDPETAAEIIRADCIEIIKLLDGADHFEPLLAAEAFPRVVGGE